MQINMDAIKKMVKDLFLNKTIASAPSTWAKVVLVPLAFGGVSGKVKLSIPNTTEMAEAIRKVVASCSVVRLNTLSIIQPTAIHPMVPKKRMEGNSLLGSCIWRKETELARARVGAYISEYNNKNQ